MISPTHILKGRKNAHSAEVTNLLIELRADCAMLTSMERKPAAVGSCNSVFRYPSPFGWFCGVPAGSPVFLPAECGAGTMTCAGVEHCCTMDSEPVTKTGRAEGTGKCGNSPASSHLWRSRGFRPAATLSANRPSSARARAPRQQQWLAATLPLAPLSAVRPTSSIVKNSLPGAERAAARKNFLTARPSTEEHKPSTRGSAAVAFLLPMTVDHTAGQDQEGR